MSGDRDEDELKRLIVSCEQKIFSLALYLIGGDRNRAYDAAASALADAIRNGPSEDPDGIFLRAVSEVVEKCRGTRTMPSPEGVHVIDAADREKVILGVVSRALQALPFDDKALILLRDQAHLSYAEIAPILKAGEKEVRIRTADARIRLRTNIEHWARREG